MITNYQKTQELVVTQPEKGVSPYQDAYIDLNWKWIIWSVIGIGILLRLFHFFYNRSLWIDEVFLGNSLIRMDFLQLAKGPLEYEQKAPVGFLWMVKLCILIFNGGEMALRLFPLLCGIFSLFVFRQVANHVLSPVGVIIGLAMLAIGPPMVYHAVEAKQYSTELLATLVALYLYFKYHRKREVLSMIMWGFWGALLLWFSYSSVFILAGMALGTCLYYAAYKEWKILSLSLISFSIWLISFALNFFLVTYKHAGSEWLILWFEKRQSFMPFPIDSVHDLRWFMVMPYYMLQQVIGLTWFELTNDFNYVVRGLARMPLLPLICWLAGMLVLFRENRKLFLVMVFPFLLMMLASGLKMYPMFERLMLFLAPLLILFIVCGSESIMSRFYQSKWRYVLPLFLLAGAIGNSAGLLLNPSLVGGRSKNMHAREVLLYANERLQQGDVVYIYWNFQPFYRFYKEAYHLKYDAKISINPQHNTKDPTDYLMKLNKDLAGFSGQERIWFIYNRRRKNEIGKSRDPEHWYHKKEVMPGTLVEQNLSTRGKKLDFYSMHDVNLSLFSIISK